MTFMKNYAYNKKDDAFQVFLPGGDGYFKFTLKRLTIPYIDGKIYQNQDLWRLYQLYLCRKTENGFENIYDFPIANTGEWECAMKITGTPDFHGGFHGYEHFTKYSFSALDDRFEFVQESNIYLQGTRDDLVATHKKHYLFKDGALSIDQSLEWKKSVPVMRIYFAMLPIRRKEEDFQITDTALYNGECYDISEEGHTTPLSPGCELKVKEMTVCSKTSGITATLTVDYDNDFFIQNTPQYNKLYFNYAKDVQTKVGEVWKATSTYKFTYSTPR